MPDALPRHGAGYITDVAYPDHFHRETLPSWLVATATALGRTAPALDAPYTWLDLGCGAGLGVLLAAAANPTGRFLGVDFSAREIDRARRTAGQAGLTNVQFACLDVNDAGAQALPACDFIVSHGMLSWVGQDTRTSMVRFIHQHLKPGGIAYLAYMSQPGSAAFASARRLLQMSARRAQGDSAARARAGMALLQGLAQGGAGFFVEHPAASREVLRAHTLDDAYLAHELLNDEWHALHVADVMSDLAAGDCDYLGSATLLDNIDAMSIPGKVLPLLADLHRQGAPVAETETFRDVARNQSLRRDLYQRAAPPGTRLTPDAHRQALLAQRVCLLPLGARQLATSDEHGVLDTRIGPVTIPMAHVRPLLQALAAGRQTYADIASLPAYRGNPGVVSQFLQALAWAGWLHYQPPAAAMKPVPDVRRAAERALAEHGYGDWSLMAEAGSAVRRAR